MKTILTVIQIVNSVLLISFILIQTKGTGFGRAWGISSTSFARRGLEKVIFKASFVLAVIFVFVSIVKFLI